MVDKCRRERHGIRPHPAAIGDHHYRVDRHPVPVVHRDKPAPPQCRGQLGGQAGAIGDQPHRRRPRL